MHDEWIILILININIDIDIDIDIDKNNIFVMGKRKYRGRPFEFKLYWPIWLLRFTVSSKPFNFSGRTREGCENGWRPEISGSAHSGPSNTFSLVNSGGSYSWYETFHETLSSGTSNLSTLLLRAYIPPRHFSCFWGMGAMNSLSGLSLNKLGKLELM